MLPQPLHYAHHSLTVFIDMVIIQTTTIALAALEVKWNGVSLHHVIHVVSEEVKHY